MQIKELKELIKDLPDNMKVITTLSSVYSCRFDEHSIGSVVTLYRDPEGYLDQDKGSGDTDEDCFRIR